MAEIDLNCFEISPFGKPNTPGVYAVWVMNYVPYFGTRHLLYIGSTKNIDKRLKGPNHPYRIAFSRFNCRPVWTSFYETEDYREIEKTLIEKYQPVMNKQWR